MKSFIKKKHYQQSKMKIYTAHISLKILNAVVEKIKEKKELTNLDTERCTELIKKQCMQNKKLTLLLSTAKSFEDIERAKELKKLIKEVRAVIRRQYGLFQTKDIIKAPGLLQDLDKALKKIAKENKAENLFDDQKVQKIHMELLKIHVSTKERLPFYSKFFQDIFAVTGRPKSILDIACGFNPLAIQYMNHTPERYTATELNKKDTAIITSYFTTLQKVDQYKKLKLKTIQCDLEKKEDVNKLRGNFDVCFALKIFDLLENKTSEYIVKKITCKWLIASFSTKTITKAPMRFKRRASFQKMLRRLGFEYTTITFSNEIAYVIKKK